MDNEQDQRQQEPISYNLTDHCCQFWIALTCPLHCLPLIPGMLGTRTLTLEAEEAFLTTQNWCCTVHTRRPYGELQSVDRVNYCGCVGVGGPLFPYGVVCPGAGCDADLVNTVVRAMKERMKNRGDTGQIRRTEEALEQIQALRKEVSGLRQDVRAVMKALDVETPSSNDAMVRL